jgi:hypothetical protein
MDVRKHFAIPSVMSALGVPLLELIVKKKAYWEYSSLELARCVLAIENMFFETDQWDNFCGAVKADAIQQLLKRVLSNQQSEGK